MREISVGVAAPGAAPAMLLWVLTLSLGIDIARNTGERPEDSGDRPRMAERFCGGATAPPLRTPLGTVPSAPAIIGRTMARCACTAVQGGTVVQAATDAPDSMMLRGPSTQPGPTCVPCQGL
jgi:hypothetical protein